MDPTKVASTSRGLAFRKSDPSRLVLRSQDDEGGTRTIDWLPALVKPYVRDEEPNVSIVHDETDIPFCIISQHFVRGYFHCVPRNRPRFSLDLRHCVPGYFRNDPYRTHAERNPTMSQEM
jgi:hypothetical protein